MNDSIKTTKLDTVKATILAYGDYRPNFDGFVTVYKDFIKQLDGNIELKIYALRTNSDGKGCGGGGGSGTGGNTNNYVADRYFKK